MTAQDVALLVLTQVVAVLVAGGLVAWTTWDVWDVGARGDE